MAERASPQDWLLDRMLTVASENEKKTIWLIGAFILLSFVSIALNLGAIESAEMNLLFLKSSLTDNWPIRLLMVIGTMLAFLLIAYFFLEAQKTVKTIMYLDSVEHDRASEVNKLGVWMLENSPQVLKQQIGVLRLLYWLSMLILLLVCGSFVYSLFF